MPSRIVSTLLEILGPAGAYAGYAEAKFSFQPFLRFWRFDFDRLVRQFLDGEFQPFLRFWGLCVWLLWFFKFFFGFGFM